MPFIGGPIDFASFITTNPENADTDGDGLSDGQEVEARSLRADPALAAEYAFLIDAGLETYYKLIANPNDPDSDDDGLNDLLEVLNGTNPLAPDGSNLGIEGLDLPPFTLFQPDEYDEKPAISRRLTAKREGDTLVIERVFYNGGPVRYDDERDCVETCDAIEDLARARPDDSGFAICVGPISINCANDESQERDIVEEARVAQGVFDGDGSLSETFLREQIGLQCAIWYVDLRTCLDEAVRVDLPDDVSADDFAALLAGGTIAIPGQVPNTETLRRIAEALRRTAAVAAAGIGAAALTDALVRVLRGPALKGARQLLPFRHPCEIQPMYAPGRTSGKRSATESTRCSAIPGSCRRHGRARPSVPLDRSPATGTSASRGVRPPTSRLRPPASACRCRGPSSRTGPCGKPARRRRARPIRTGPLSATCRRRTTVSKGTASTPSSRPVRGDAGGSRRSRGLPRSSPCRSRPSRCSTAEGEVDARRSRSLRPARRAGGAAPPLASSDRRRLRRGASADRVRTMLGAEGLGAPDDLVAWWGWHDGAGKAHVAEGPGVVETPRTR